MSKEWQFTIDNNAALAAHADSNSGENWGWFGRHLILTVLLGLLIVFGIYVAISILK